MQFNFFFLLWTFYRGNDIRDVNHVLYIYLGQNKVFFAMEGLEVHSQYNPIRMRLHTRARHGTPACYNMRDKSRAVGIAD